MSRIKSIYIIFIFNLFKFNFNCQQLEKYYKLYKGLNETQSMPSIRLKCGLNCLKSEDCRMALIREQNCTIVNECSRIDYNKTKFFLIKKKIKNIKIDSNFTCN